MRRLLAGGSLPRRAAARAVGRRARGARLAGRGPLARGCAPAGDRVLALDFDEFLADVAGHLGRVLAHFGLPRDEALLRAIMDGPVLRQYSKAPELPFPPDERATRLAESRRDNRDEIAKGLAWLERLARADDRIAAVVSEGAA